MKGTPLRCDCGCNQVMAVLYADRLEIKARAHGKTHTLTIRVNPKMLTASQKAPHNVVESNR